MKLSSGRAVAVACLGLALVMGCTPSANDTSTGETADAVPSGNSGAGRPATGGAPSTTMASSPGCGPVSGTPVGALPEQPPPVVCRPLSSGPSTFVNGANRWVDEFDHGLSFASMGAGYQTYEAANDSVHWRHADHWMVDLVTDGLHAGAVMRPDRSFRFVDGKLVVEAVSAAGMDVYGNEVWPEIVVSAAPEPTFVGGLYTFDMFPEGSTIGCRLQSSRWPICALKANDGRAGSFGVGEESTRLYEISQFQVEGDSVYGGAPFGEELDEAWRVCRRSDPDGLCRDRFRMELTRTSLTLYVNDVKYFQQTGLRALPDDLFNGDVYVYFNGMAVRASGDVARFHWDRIAVNP